MNDLKAKSSSLEIPHKWRQNYLIKRIGEDDIEISPEVRNNILKCLQQGDRFVQVGQYTLMLNGIKSIDPLWGGDNIPPKPEVEQRTIDVDDLGQDVRQTTNQAEIDLWNKLFGGLLTNYLTT